jgi:hypothetical protein
MEHETSTDPDIKRLQDKAKQGATNVVTEVLADPKVQSIIKGALLRETIRNSMVMACILVGLLKFYDVVKIVTGFDWRGDLCISVVLILIGLVYTLQNLFSPSKQADNKS